MTRQQEQLDRLVAEYRQTFHTEKAKWQEQVRLEQQGRAFYVPRKPKINWDEAWDGKLLERAQLITDTGYWVSRILRSQKITIRLEDHTRKEFSDDMFRLFDLFRGLTFDPPAIWWGIATRYRG